MNFYRKYNLNSNFIIVVIGMFIVLGQSLYQFSFAVCSDQIPNLWEDSRYNNHNNGTVTDTQTNLMWKHCTEGLFGSNCSQGSLTTFSWKQALELPQIINDADGFAGFNDWRLPNIEELRSLAALNCYNPAINQNIFPNTPVNPFSSWYWSSSPYAGNDGYAWGYIFSTGGDSADDRIDDHLVRLVRSGK